MGVKNGAVSVDHLERMGEEEILLLGRSQTIPTMLPGASFFLGIPYAPARPAVAAGLPVALASDYNPGSSPSGDMRLGGHNGSAGMGLLGSCGSVTPGKFASLIITRPLSSLSYIPYAYTEPFIEQVLLKGRSI